MTMSRVFLPVKSNLAEQVNGLKYRIISVELPGGINTSCIEWLGETDKDAFEVLAPRLTTQKDRPAIEGAKDWLDRLLKKGPMKSVKVKESSKESPHAWMTIRRAAAELKIQSIKRGPFFGSCWWWMTEDQAAVEENPNEQVQAEGDHEHAQTGKPTK
jgi:hypothetical protein